ncbi:hypothetical protein [Aquisalinus flavus]|uniref:Lipoprotein n=1 Tax=Aquisalinus flavus TaxID=1526572 RepID=A0A8J2Y5I1_9PROT|nr:hypothetical protein [Aquisalinus flavus]MBD0425757.1 hypothetical protein [Aquisalinus flavus]UNE48634.1 hypothetical protein FF099_11540 [Aquisalinus flavus]GGD13522.1 hypothetical protein GCM10011342_22850 [Aquisalinus flavus]
MRLMQTVPVMLAAAMLAVSACTPMDNSFHNITGNPRPVKYEPSCQPGEITAQNAIYAARYQSLWQMTRERLYVNTVAPRTEQDIKRANAYQREMEALEAELSRTYSRASNSCSALLKCESGATGDSWDACEAKRGDMLIAQTDFYGMGGRLDSQASRILSWEPFADVPAAEYDAKKADKDDAPDLNRKRNCPTVSDVLTVCSDDD